jgi:signal transduction histidine kinase
MVPLKRHLLFLVLGALLPLLALAAALTVILVEQDRSRTQHALHENARLLSSALDGELNRSITAMYTLGRSEALRRGDLAHFYGEAKDVRDALGLWDNVLLLSPNGEHLFNLLRPFGTKLPPVPQPEGPVTATKTREPYISNTLRGRVDTDWLMFMNTPVLIDGEVKYVLGVTMNYRFWSRWLRERAPQNLNASIVDRNYVVLARTVDAERLAGQPVQPWFRDVMAASLGGTVRGQGLIDPDLVVAFHRSELSGWYVSLFTSGAVLDAPGRRTALMLAIGVALALAIAVFLALRRATVLTRGIRGLQQALEGLKGERPQVAPLASRVREVDAAIAAALNSRQDEIDALQADLRAQADAQRLLVALHDATRGLRDPEEVMFAVAVLVARHFHVSRCTYGEIDESQEYAEVARDYVEGVPSIVGRRRLAEFGPALIAELKAGRTLVVTDVETDARTSAPETRAAFAALEVRSVLCVPLVKANRWVAVFILNHREPRAWSAADAALAEQVAERTWFAVENARVEAELRRLNQELSQADRRKDEFLATLAHELRNPLAPIRSAAEILNRIGLTEPGAIMAREIIERQALHLTRMVDDLLEVGRITHGELRLRKETVALADAVAEAVQTARPGLDAARVQLAVEPPPQPLFVEADPTRLVQILGNLLGNAAKFTPRGGHVWLSAKRAGAWIEIRLRDDGIGIEAHQLPRIFEMFSQATPVRERSHGGLGIGLALVRGLVERHGGTVEAMSEGKGRGAEFVVRLPASSRSPVSRTKFVEEKKSPRRVLLADDNHDAADSLAELLRAMGHEVHVVYNGESALRAGAELRPETVILDIGMPRLDGYEVARRARQTDWGRGAKLIALTGWGQERDKALAAEAGFDHHLTKPVQAAALEALLA